MCGISLLGVLAVRDTFTLGHCRDLYRTGTVSSEDDRLQSRGLCYYHHPVFAPSDPAIFVAGVAPLANYSIWNPLEPL